MYAIPCDFYPDDETVFGSTLVLPPASPMTAAEIHEAMATAPQPPTPHLSDLSPPPEPIWFDPEEGLGAAIAKAHPCAGDPLGLVVHPSLVLMAAGLSVDEAVARAKQHLGREAAPIDVPWGFP